MEKKIYQYEPTVIPKEYKVKTIPCQKCSGTKWFSGMHGQHACECDKGKNYILIRIYKAREPKPVIPPKMIVTKLDKAKEIYRWLLGYETFEPRKDGEGAYWWRKELRKRLIDANIKINK